MRTRIGRKAALGHVVYRQFALVCSKVTEQKPFAELAVCGSLLRKVVNINELSWMTLNLFLEGCVVALAAV